MGLTKKGMFLIVGSGSLIRLGAGKWQAISLGLSSKGYYRLVKIYAVQLGLNDKWLKDLGLVSIREQWIKFNYN